LKHCVDTLHWVRHNKTQSTKNRERYQPKRLKHARNKRKPEKREENSKKEHENVLVL